MMIDLLFSALMILSCGYASVAGKRDGRLVSLMFVAAWLASFPAVRFVAFDAQHHELLDIHLFVIDIFLYVGLGTVAKTSRCFWPIWVFGFHLANLACDLLIFFGGSWPPIMSYVLQAFWSIPELLVMPIGIHLDRTTRFRQS